MAIVENIHLMSGSAQPVDLYQMLHLFEFRIAGHYGSVFF